MAAISAVKNAKLKTLKKILCASVFLTEYGGAEARTYLEEQVGPGYSISYWNLNENPITKENYNDSHPLKNCDILLGDTFLGEKYARFLKESSVKWLHSSSAGVDKLTGIKDFKDYLEDVGFVNALVITRTSYTESMVVYCLAQICSHQHGLDVYRQQEAQNLWKKTMKVRPLSSKVVGLLGVGDVGGSIAAACKQTLNMRCVGYSSRTTQKENFDHIYTNDLDSLLAECDFVINTLPSSPTTKHLLSGDRLKSAAGRSPVFINVGRGSIIDEDSIIRAVDSNWISHAVLDVVEVEPLPADSKLWGNPKVTITPHISGGPVAEITYPFVVDSFVANLKLLKEDKPLQLVVNYEKGY